MKTRLALFSALSLLVVTACGGGEQTHAASAAQHKHETKNEPKIAGPVGEFHGVLSPIWHSAKGPERLAKACDQAKTMAERAAAIEAAPPPAGAKAEGYKAAAKGLSASVAAFTTACAAPARADAEGKLSALHDAFHKVAAESGANHDAH